MITVIGSGKVGSAAAFDILRYKISDVVLIDTNEKAAKGEALDMMQAAPAIEFDGTITGTGDFREMTDSELVIVTAGVGRRPGMSRIDLINVNAGIVRGIFKEIAKYAPKAKVMMVTNPVDVMTYLALKRLVCPVAACLAWEISLTLCVSAATSLRNSTFPRGHSRVGYRRTWR